MPNMMVTEVFKSMVQGPFESCMTRTVSLGGDNERGIFLIANGAIDAVVSNPLRVVYLTSWNGMLDLA